jgi:hypothetical protein
MKKTILALLTATVLIPISASAESNHSSVHAQASD